MGFSEYDSYDALGLAQLVRDGEVSALELLDEAIERMEKVNGTLNAIVHRHYDLARENIERGLPDGAFTGVPFLLKDLHLHMAGTKKSNGSAMWQGYICTHDSILVERYKAAGLNIFGRTNSPELGLQPVTEPRVYGPTRNPWDTSRTSGGSSGGAAAAVAAGILPMAHASDGGGSIRIPASCCGLVGLKPSRARIPFGPDKSEGWAGQSTSHIVSRTARDTAAMLDATAGFAHGEAYTAPHHGGSFLSAVSEEPGGLRIAVSREKWGRGQYSPEVLEGLDNTIAKLESLGHEVVEARPDFDAEAAGLSMYKIICVSTAVDIGQRAEELGCSIDEMDMEDGTRFSLDMAHTTTATEYAQAVQANHALGRLLAEFHRDYDIVLLPTLASPPIPIGYLGDASPEEYSDRLFAYMGDTALFNQTGQPSMSLPLHWTEDQLPVGMMFSADYGNDALLLQLAGQLERQLPWSGKRPPLHAGVS